MDEYRENVKKVQKALNQDAAFIQPNPYLAQRVLNAANKECDMKGGYIVMKKRTILIVFAFVMLMSSLTAYATVLLVGHDVELHDGVEVIDLLPDQLQEYDICHRISEGYLIGGFSMEEDYIAPMDENDSIVMLDENFHVKWILSDPRLEGCLFDKIIEAEDAFFFGLESAVNDWGPAVMKISKDGIIEWFYFGDVNVELNDFSIDAHGNVVCVGSTEMDGMQKACILTIEPNGTVQDIVILSELPINSISAIMIENGKAILAGYGEKVFWVGEMNEDGETVWQESGEGENSIKTLRLQTNQKGNIVLSLEFHNANEDGMKHMQYFVVTK